MEEQHHPVLAASEKGNEKKTGYIWRKESMMGNRGERFPCYRSRTSAPLPVYQHWEQTNGWFSAYGSEMGGTCIKLRAMRHKSRKTMPASDKSDPSRYSSGDFPNGKHSEPGPETQRRRYWWVSQIAGSCIRSRTVPHSGDPSGNSPQLCFEIANGIALD